MPGDDHIERGWFTATVQNFDCAARPFTPGAADSNDEVGGFSSLPLLPLGLPHFVYTIATLKTTPHKGSLRDEIAPGIRAIPAGRKAVVAFLVDDEAAEVLIYAVTYGGADWSRRTGARSR